MGISSSRPRTPRQVTLTCTDDNEISTPIRPKLLNETPWRQLEKSGHSLLESLLQEIKGLNPKRNPLILLLGPVGAGKSSFINSCLSVVEGRKISLAKSGSASSSYTSEFRNYSLLEKFRLRDCMGIEPNHGEGFHTDDILFLLQGHVMKNYKFDQTKSMTTDSPFYRKKPEFEHKTHCVVFVVDSRAVHNGIPTEYVKKIQILQEKVKHADVHRVLILTHVDKLCEEAKKDSSNIFRSLIIEKTENLASELFSIDIGSIHPLINYEEMLEVSTEMSIPILLALRQILRNSCDRIEYVLKELQDCDDELKPQLSDVPWRSLDEDGYDSLESAVKNIKAIGTEIKPIILLVGPVGAGKSSFINSCLTVGAKRKKVNAKTGSASSSYTSKSKIFKDRAFLENFRLMDCMGIQPGHGRGIHLDDISFLLQGHVKDSYKFDPANAITRDSNHYREKTGSKNKVHCVVLVVDSRFMNNDDPHQYDKIKIIEDKIKEADVPRVLILTHADKLCKAVSDNASNIFRSLTVESAIKKASEVFSIEMASIHPVVNYEETSELTTAVNIPILLALRQIFHYSCDRLEEILDSSDDSKGDDA